MANLDDLLVQEGAAPLLGYLAAHPEWSLDGVSQPMQGATNLVVVAGRGADRVVLKLFRRSERYQRERLALMHWAGMGLVPRLLDEQSPRLLVMSYLPGDMLHVVRARQGEQAWLDGCQAVGEAAARLTQVELAQETGRAYSARFYEGMGSLDRYLGRIVGLGESIHRLDADFQDGYWGASLGLIGDELDGILGEPRGLYHQDASNLHLADGRFEGFFDLEMTRVGGPTMQIASCLRLFEFRRRAWERFAAGWVRVTGQALDSRRVLAAGHLLAWREICRYLSYDGTPGSGYDWASPADPDWYRGLLDGLGEMLSLAV